MRIWEFIYLSIEAARAAGDKSPALDQSGLIGLRPSGSACVFVCVCTALQTRIQCQRTLFLRLAAELEFTTQNHGMLKLRFNNSTETASVTHWS